MTGAVVVSEKFNREGAADPGWWGKDVLSVCTAPAPFSCWWDKQDQAVRTVDEQNGQSRQCLQIAGEVITGDLSDPTGGADHDHRDDVRPAWAAGRKPIRTIGRHLFYRVEELAAAEADAAPSYRARTWLPASPNVRFPVESGGQRGRT